jgi:hypothetical protein
MQDAVFVFFSRVVAAVMVVVAVAMVAMVAGAGRQVCGGRGLVLSKWDVCRSRSVGFFRMRVFEGSKTHCNMRLC